ncbi:MAG: hypothetical protein AABX75_00260, partial [Nanoarchaeota archaeon]
MEEIKENKMELMMYQLVIVIVIGFLIALAAGFMAGRTVGFSGGVDAVQAKIPDYCTVNKQGSEINVKCNEMGLSLDDVCAITSPALRSKVRVVSLGSTQGTTN